MLDLMRKHARSWLIKVALGGVIIVFIFWYGWSGPRDQNVDYLAKVNGTIISYEQLNQIYQSQLDEFRRRYRGGIPPGLLEKLDLKKNIATALVHRVLLLQEAQRIGLFVTDEELVHDIRSNPRFQIDGVFNDRMYRDYLATAKMSPAMYEVDRRKQLLEEQVAHLLTDGVKTDPEEIKRLWHFQNDKLVLSFALLVPQTEKDAPPADPKELEAFYKEHQTKYEIPASVDVDYVAFSWRDLKKKMSVSEEDARAYYDLHPRDFTVPERFRVRHILLKLPKGADKETAEKARKVAEDLLARIRKGEDFATLAREVSEDEATREKGGDLGFVAKGGLNRNLQAALEKLDVGEVSEPFLTDQGYHIIKLEEKKPETQVDFEAARETIVDKLLEERARKKANTVAEEFYEQAYRSENLKDAAEKFGLEVKTAKSLTKGAGLPNLGNDPKIMEEAFELSPGGISRLITSGDSFAMMKLLEFTKERIPTLEEVRSRVENDFRKEQALIKAVKKARQFIEELQKQPEDAEKLAKQSGLTWKKLDPVSRTIGFVPQLGSSPDVKEMLATVSPEAPLFTTPVRVTEGVAVVRLVDVQRASEEQYAKEAPIFEKWVREVRQTEFLKGWLRVMEKKSEIELNDKRL